MKKILVYVGEDLLGDAILKLPFIYGLRRTFPKAHITWWAGYKKSMFAGPLQPLVEGYLDEVKEIPLKRATLLKDHFDLIIDTQRKLKPTLLLRKISHDKFLSRTSHYFFSDFKRPPKESCPHISSQLLNFLSTVTPLERLTEFSVTLDKKYIEAVKPLFPKNQIYIGLLIGAGQPERRWPIENFIKVARTQIERNRVPVFILGPQETEWWEILQEKVPEALFPLQEHAQLRESPLYTTAIGNFMACTVASDSGGGHLLGISKTPLVSLFARSSHEKVKPLSKNLTILFEGSRMADLPVKKVEDTIEEILT